MADKLEYLENKSRQNNIRIHQVKEESDESVMVEGYSIFRKTEMHMEGVLCFMFRTIFQ